MLFIPSIQYEDIICLMKNEESGNNMIASFLTEKEAHQFGSKVFEDVLEKYPERVKNCTMRVVKYEKT